MKLFILSSILFLELVSCSSDLDCFLDHQECEIHEDNLITTVTDVPTMDQCLALCQDEFTCVAFTYFGTEGYPLRESCVMFSDCSIRRPCQGCTTGSSQSECLCSIQYSSEIDSGNFVDMVSAVDEHDCKRKCFVEEKCKVYSYYDSEDLMNPSTCFLMNANGIQSPVIACDHCTTGPVRCEFNQKCQVAVITNGSSTQVIFAEESMSVNLVAAENCFVDLNIVAIGGGGGGSYYYAGAGSGYVEASTVRINTSSPVAEITVGQLDESSKVEIAGKVVVEALPGKIGSNSHSGGDGYSGGGGYGDIRGGMGGSGGSDGGNGTSYPGGKGSGFDLSLVGLKNFILTPGAGGQPHGDYYGGGGGGVIVNGKMPPAYHKYAGFGHGGGSTDENMYDPIYPGYPGCVIVEI